MYVPASFSVSDENTLHDFIERYDFATLISGSAAALTASHIPMVALKSLVARYEKTRLTPWRMDDLEADFYTKLAAAVVAFEMPVDRIEGKFKLGQNRCREDRMGTLEGLKAEGAPESGALAEFISQHAPVE